MILVISGCARPGLNSMLIPFGCSCDDFGSKSDLEGPRIRSLSNCVFQRKWNVYLSKIFGDLSVYLNNFAGDFGTSHSWRSQWLVIILLFFLSVSYCVCMNRQILVFNWKCFCVFSCVPCMYAYNLTAIVEYLFWMLLAIITTLTFYFCLVD